MNPKFEHMAHKIMPKPKMSRLISCISLFNSSDSETKLTQFLPQLRTKFELPNTATASGKFFITRLLETWSTLNLSRRRARKFLYHISNEIYKFFAWKSHKSRVRSILQIRIIRLVRCRIREKLEFFEEI